MPTHVIDSHAVLLGERRDGQTVPIDTRRFPGVQPGYAHTEYREQGSTRYAELHLVDQHVNQRSLVVGMTRHAHRYGMHYSAETVGSFENLVQFGERSRDKASLEEFAVRDLATEQREGQELQRARERQTQEQKREREAAGSAGIAARLSATSCSRSRPSCTSTARIMPFRPGGTPSSVSSRSLTASCGVLPGGLPGTR